MEGTLGTERWTQYIPVPDDMVVWKDSSGLRFTLSEMERLAESNRPDDLPTRIVTAHRNLSANTTAAQIVANPDIPTDSRIRELAVRELQDQQARTTINQKTRTTVKGVATVVVITTVATAVIICVDRVIKSMG